MLKVIAVERETHLRRVLVWIRSPAGEQQAAVLGHVDRAAASLLHEHVHQAATDLDVVPAVAALVLAAYQHA